MQYRLCTEAHPEGLAVAVDGRVNVLMVRGPWDDVRAVTGRWPGIEAKPHLWQMTMTTRTYVLPQDSGVLFLELCTRLGPPP